ncbi:MAG: hypothetical protein OEZ20_05220 [candidate division WOR-3 bacterium]|nr:hypothetical protein [candidate division WOR-3 bacterium]MDH5683846.1 hypothetical protein [candidate division WOR-3 bacterium]
MKRINLLFKILILILVGLSASFSYALEKNRKPSLIDVEFHPYRGKIRDQYIAHAVYSDPDGDIPTNIAIYVDKTFYPLNLVKILKKAHQGLEPYEALYRTIISLPYGEHSYYFYADDGKGKYDRVPRYGEIKAPFVGIRRPYNRAPRLADGGVQLQQGSENDYYVYSVWYYDPEYYETPNRPPKEIAVFVDGIKIPMKLQKGKPNNGFYMTVHNFSEEALRAYQYENEQSSPERHGFFFRAIDADGFCVYLPEDGFIQGPDITLSSNHPPKLLDPRVEPEIGTPKMAYSYYITYEDEDGDLPAFVHCVVNDNVHKMRLKTGSKHKGIYYFRTKQFAGNSHRYYFYAEDGHGNGSRVPEKGIFHGPVVVDK